jgi:hypothetical protein
VANDRLGHSVCPGAASVSGQLYMGNLTSRSYLPFRLACYRTISTLSPAGRPPGAPPRETPLPIHQLTAAKWLSVLYRVLLPKMASIIVTAREKEAGQYQNCQCLGLRRACPLPPYTLHAHTVHKTPRSLFCSSPCLLSSSVLVHC